MSDTDPAYIGVKLCGCVEAALVDTGRRAENARELAKWARWGLTIERTTVGEARAHPRFMKCECAGAATTPQQETLFA